MTVSYAFAICAIGVLSLAEIVYLPKGLVLYWEFGSDQIIEFGLNVSQEIAGSYQWAGVGFKHVDSERGMVNADLVNIIFNNTPLDCFGPKHGGPVEDTEEPGGTNDLTNAHITQDQQTTTYTWQRKLNTNDPYDIIFQPNAYYRLLYAYGNLSDGFQLPHSHEDRGTIDIYLSDNSIGPILTSNSN